MPDLTTALHTAQTICPTEPLDLGIAHIVQTLIDHAEPLGALPYESCDGSPEHCSPVPMVRLHGSAGAAWHAVAVCLDRALPVSELRRIWRIASGGVDGPPVWELRFRREVTGGLVTPPMMRYLAMARDATTLEEATDA